MSSELRTGQPAILIAESQVAGRPGSWSAKSAGRRLSVSAPSDVESAGDLGNLLSRSADGWGDRIAGRLGGWEIGWPGGGKASFRGGRKAGTRRAGTRAFWCPGRLTLAGQVAASRMAGRRENESPGQLGYWLPGERECGLPGG
jgi:hypothetical protein